MLTLVPRRCTFVLSLAFAAMTAASICSAPVPTGNETEWGQFLGPMRNGISTETSLKLDWNKKAPKTMWKVPLGSALSSLAIAGDRLVTTAKRGDRDFIVCLRIEDGKELWAVDAAPTYIDKQRAGAGPRSTPTIAGDYVYCQMPRGDLLCVALKDGKQKWKKNIFEVSGAKERFGEFYYWGVSYSPLVEGDLVVTLPGGDKDNAVLALNKDDGKKVWSVGGDSAGYGSPITITAHKRRMIVCPMGKAVLGLDAGKGDILWRYLFGNEYDATCSTPVWTNDLLFVSAAYGTGCAAVEIKKDGEVFTAAAKWKNKDLQNLMATSIILDGYAYGCHGDLGAIQMKCVDLKTGEVKWDERQKEGRFGLIAAEGHLICLSEKGSVYLVEANHDRFVEKGRLEKVLEYKAWAMPALAKKRLYVRDESHIVCIDLSKE
jgi:outer membrane protein assembly factor BamB